MEPPVKRRISGLFFAALGATCVLASWGCGHKDPTEQAAPPPSQGAVPEQHFTKPRVGPAGPTSMGGGATAGGPMTKP
jgi:hypothetical protein